MELAGIALTEALKGQTDAEKILSHPDPKIRWYRALKFLSGAHKTDSPGYQTNEAGENLGWIFGGTFYNLPEVAGNVCLKLHGKHPIKALWYERIYEQYGKEIIVGLVIALASAKIGLWIK